MPLLCLSSPIRSVCALPASALLLLAMAVGPFGSCAFAQEGPLPEAVDPPAQPPSAQQSPAPVIRQATPSGSPYDKAIFLRPLPPDQLGFLSQFANDSTADLYRSREFRKLMKNFVPDCMFHYGRDMPLQDALDLAMDNSREPVVIREGRYVMLSGARGPYLGGRAFLWIDLQDGIGLGAFYFHPTNGEPTPTVAVFSRQVKETTLAMSQLPPAFASDLAQWTANEQIAPITTRYFLTGNNRRILLEHDEDFCALGDGTMAPPDSGCQQMNADAADIDETAAYYLDQVHYATNATAWMIGPDQVAWLQVRADTCGGVADPLGCRIRVTREHTHLIIHRGPMPHPIRR